MRTVSYRLADLQRAVIPIGFVGESEHTRVIFDSKRVFDEYPSAVSALTVQPPAGEAYPAVIVRDGESVYWDVYDSDLAEEGRGEAQLTFSQGGVVVKSFIFRTIIERSIMGEGEVPEPLDDFLARAGEALTAIPQTIQDTFGEIIAEAETLPAGSSATAAFDSENMKLSFGIPAGDPGDPGDPGSDGVSPTVVISNIVGGHRVTVTDENGDHSFDVMDGAEGDPGDPGTDGVSPTVSISKSGKTTTVTITDKNGDHTATILDGEDGSSAIDDTAGDGDTDKVWSADKSAEEVSTLNGAINVISGSLPETTLSFVSGSINSRGASVTGNTRIRLDSGYMQLINDGDYFFVDELYKGVVRLYNSAAVSENTYYGAANGGEWANGAIPLKGYAGKYAVIVLQKVGSESSDISADVSTMPTHVSYISFPATIDKRFEKVDELNGYMQLTPTYTQGGFGTASAGNSISRMTLNTDTNRARTNADKTYNSGIILPANTPIKIYADEGYQIAYQVYNSSGTAQDTFAFASGNLIITKAFEVSFFLMARKTDNSSITTAEAAQHIKIYIPIGTYKLDFNVSQSLSQQQKDIAKTNLGISDQGGIVTIPFEFSIPINIYKNAGKYQTDFNPHNNAITKTNGVVVFLSPNGDDTDTGLSYTHPKKTIESALSVSNVATIIFASGTYTHGVHFTNGLTITADINFIANGNVIIDNGTGSPITFTGNVYCDGITFKGGDNAVITAQTANQTATFFRCVFCESDTLNGLALQGGKGFVFDCVARDNAYDGFNYHANGTVTGEYVEVNCEAYGNGTKYLTGEAGQSSNGTTSHDGCNIVRINGNYYSCHGGVLADKDCASANYGCSAGVSTITDSNYPDRMSNYWSSGAIMYLYSCASYGSKYDTARIRNGSIISDVEYPSNYSA